MEALKLLIEKIWFVDSLKSWNDTIWAFVFSYIGAMYDNVAFCIMAFGLICSFTAIIVRKLICKKSYVFGPINILAALSSSYAVIRIPMIHPRMNKALSTVSSIVSQSKVYLSNFNEATKTTSGVSLDIAKTLYYATKNQRTALVSTFPESVYKHFFSAYDSMNKVGQLGYVYEAPSVMMVLCAGTISFIVFYKISQEYRLNMINRPLMVWNNIGISILRAIIFTALFSLNFGSAICVTSMVFYEIVILYGAKYLKLNIG